MKAVSLFTGAGGMDVGFENAGIEILASSEIDPLACETYQSNRTNSNVILGDVTEHLAEFKQYEGLADLVFGGPPCQGFSVAGKMDPNDPRSNLIWTFCNVVEIVKPKYFVMENVKALAVLEKWRFVREEYYRRMNSNGYLVCAAILNSSEYGVSQKRERVFFIGVDKKLGIDPANILPILESKKEMAPTIRELFSKLPEHGTEGNPKTCKAKVTLAEKPVMRKSPYAGMYFNGQGRPINLDGYANTLPASMGGNKTPIIDDHYLKDKNGDNWIDSYHKGLMKGTIKPKFCEAPPFLRRISVTEAAAIQSFPRNYVFCGGSSAAYRQIGNAVPCLLAQKVAESLLELTKVC